VIEHARFELEHIAQRLVLTKVPGKIVPMPTPLLEIEEPEHGMFGWLRRSRHGFASVVVLVRSPESMVKSPGSRADC
jgi:hypothetical protein